MTHRDYAAKLVNEIGHPHKVSLGEVTLHAETIIAEAIKDTRLEAIAILKRISAHWSASDPGCWSSAQIIEKIKNQVVSEIMK